MNPTLLQSIQNAVSNHPNKSALAKAAEVNYGTLVNVARGGDLTFTSAQKLVPHLFENKNLAII